MTSAWGSGGSRPQEAEWGSGGSRPQEAEWGSGGSRPQEAQRHIDRIRRDVSITGNLTDEQREQLRTVAERCPVHQTLVSEIVITSGDGEGQPGTGDR
jgi:hypothetical protein